MPLLFTTQHRLIWHTAKIPDLQQGPCNTFMVDPGTDRSVFAGRTFELCPTKMAGLDENMALLLDLLSSLPLPTA